MIFLEIALDWLLVGAAWSAFFIGILAVKAWKGSGHSPPDLFAIIVLIICFIVSAVGWPWSIYYNVPQMIKERRL